MVVKVCMMLSSPAARSPCRPGKRGLALTPQTPVFHLVSGVSEYTPPASSAFEGHPFGLV